MGKMPHQDWEKQGKWKGFELGIMDKDTSTALKGEGKIAV